MKNTNLYVVLVVYNEYLNDIDFISRYRDSNKIKLIVVDNSTNYEIQNFNYLNSQIDGLTYISKKVNLGLSKAYNIAISTIPLDSNNWVMTLDQDTYVSDEYIINVVEAIINNSNILVKTGLIHFGSRIGSPTLLKSRKTINEIGTFRNIEAINSCLTINRALLEKIDFYDESLFLDMVDYLLFYKLRKNGIDTVEVVSGKVSQEFSGETKSTYEKELHRYSIYKKDFNNYSKITGKKNIYRIFILCRRRINLFFKYKLRN